jgi:hypothetical protein
MWKPLGGFGAYRGPFAQRNSWKVTVRAALMNLFLTHCLMLGPKGSEKTCAPWGNLTLGKRVDLNVKGSRISGQLRSYYQEFIANVFKSQFTDANPRNPGIP